MNRKEAIKSLKRIEKDIRWLSGKIDTYRKLEKSWEKRREKGISKWRKVLGTVLMLLLLTLLIYAMLMFYGNGRYESMDAFLTSIIISTYFFAASFSLGRFLRWNTSSYSSRIKNMEVAREKLLEKEERIYDKFPDMPPVNLKKRGNPKALVSLLLIIVYLTIFQYIPILPSFYVILLFFLIPPISMLTLWANERMNKRRLERILSE